MRTNLPRHVTGNHTDCWCENDYARWERTKSTGFCGTFRPRDRVTCKAVAGRRSLVEVGGGVELVIGVHVVPHLVLEVVGRGAGEGDAAVLLGLDDVAADPGGRAVGVEDVDADLVGGDDAGIGDHDVGDDALVLEAGDVVHGGDDTGTAW